MIGGAALLAVGAWDASRAVDAVGAMITAGFPVLFGALLLLTGSMVRAQKGGLSVGAGVVSIHGRSLEDRLDVPVGDVTRARLTWRDVPRDGEQERWWAVELETLRGVTLLLGEGRQRDDLLVLLRFMEERLPCPTDEAVEPAGPGPVPAGAAMPAGVLVTPMGEGHRHTFKVRGSWALSGILTVLGALSLLVGALLMAHVAENPISGFLFGPVLATLGVAFLLTTLTKALAVEELDVLPGELAHRFRLLGRPFAERRIARGDRAYARLHPRGAQGACLEVVGKDGSLLMAAAVTARSRGLNLGDLMALGTALTVALGRGA